MKIFMISLSEKQNFELNNIHKQNIILLIFNEK
jgi:hypothetical protein